MAFDLKYSGHETFALRYEWLCKLYYILEKDGTVENSDKLISRLGVGRNMVNSILYWGKVSGFFKYGNDKKITDVSEIGKIVFDKDPYFEDITTTWLLHWQILSYGNAFATYWLFFRNNATVFDTNYLVNEYKVARERKPKDWLSHSEETLSRDINTYLRSYCPKHNKSNEQIDYILSDLNLIEHAEDGTNRYQMSYRQRSTLRFELFLNALLEYKNKLFLSEKFIPMEKIMYGIYSPGRAFQLDEPSINRYSDEISQFSNEKIKIDESAGVYQWVFDTDKEDLSAIQTDVLESIYSSA